MYTLLQLLCLALLKYLLKEGPVLKYYTVKEKKQVNERER